jgi:hypothetical protein
MKRLASPLLGLSVPTNATSSSGQNDDRPAKPSPVAVIRTDAARSSRRMEKRCPQRPMASVDSAEPEERRRAEKPDLHLPQAERQQIGRQHHRDEAVCERAHGARREDAVDHCVDP